MTLSFSFSGGFNGVPTFPAASARAQLVLPDPISAPCVPAGHVVSSPLHDCGTERDLAWKVRCDVGITGKVVPVKVPNVVGGGRARSAGFGQGEKLPGAKGLKRKVDVGVEDHGQRSPVPSWKTGRGSNGLYVCMYVCMYFFS